METQIICKPVNRDFLSILEIKRVHISRKNKGKKFAYDMSCNLNSQLYRSKIFIVLSHLVVIILHKLLEKLSQKWYLEINLLPESRQVSLRQNQAHWGVLH